MLFLVMHMTSRTVQEGWDHYHDVEFDDVGRNGSEDESEAVVPLLRWAWELLGSPIGNMLEKCRTSTMEASTIIIFVPEGSLLLQDIRDYKPYSTYQGPPYSPQGLQPRSGGPGPHLGRGKQSTSHKINSLSA